LKGKIIQLDLAKRVYVCRYRHILKNSCQNGDTV
jgi:hypothetical protein